MYSYVITYWDWLLSPVYILIIAVFASRIKNKYIKKDVIYKYFLWALFAKILGAICLCLVYVYYYEVGGDTLMYDHDSSVLLKLFFNNPQDFFTVWLSPLSKETASLCTSGTGYITYIRDSNAFMVDRLLVPLKFVSFDSYLVSSILMAVVSFSGLWKLYRVFCDFYPSLHSQFAVTILFVPSVIFWGSGMLKDSWTISAAGWYTYSFYKIFIKKDFRIFSFAAIIISAAIMILIKPYIFVALLPGSFLWMVSNRLSRIKSNFLKVILGPFVVSVGLGFGLFIWSFTSSSLGKYSSIDSMLQKAAEASDDLKQDYYGGNAFDIGKIDPTVMGVLSMFPIATFTGLFRPFLWEAKNVLMIASGFENTIVLCFALYVLFRMPIKMIKEIFSNPLVLFCLIFAIFFAFSVAISTSNFGSMVRLRIPQIPFLLSGLLIIYFQQQGGVGATFQDRKRGDV